MAKAPRIRPQFELALPLLPERFYVALEQALARPDANCRGLRYGDGDGGGVILRRLERDQHVWSPALYVHVERDDEGGHRVHGRFSPSSPVWTAFVAIYLVLACVGIACACYGGAQLTMDHAPWAFVGVPIALLLAGFTYGAAFIGQGLGADDMHQLRCFVERVVVFTAMEPA
ncbi:MAG: hypothetical protein H6835_11345 [Planctomycetes bacterium]|nr:hypothetical protein [Planctomycetota bacterium]